MPLPSRTTSRPHALMHTLRRAVLRRRRLLSALLLGAAVLAGLHTVSPPPPDTTEVLVAARDLPAGAVLTDGDLTAVALPDDAVPTDLAPTSYALGRTTAGPLRRGEPITRVRLVGESMLVGHEDRVAVPIRLPDAGAAALLRVGDRIDLLATDARSGDTQEVGHDLPVIAIPQPGAVAQQNKANGRLIVVAATSQMSRILTSAAVTMYLTAVISR